MSLEQYHVIRLLKQQCQTLKNAVALEGYAMAAHGNMSAGASLIASVIRLLSC